MSTAGQVDEMPATEAVGLWFRMLGPVFLGVAIGIDLLLAGLVLIAPPDPIRDRLTLNGMQNLRPERDTLLYLLAGVVAVVGALALSKLRTLPLSARWAGWLPASVAIVTVAAATAGFVRVRQTLPLSSSGGRLYLGAAVVLGALCVLAATAGSGESPPVREGDSPGSPAAARLGGATGIRSGPLDVLVLLLLIGLVYLPQWQLLAGNAFAGEGSLHLDFFAFGPALVFRSGKALGTDLHTYYGVGWPVVFSRLNPLSYGHIIRLEVLYGCAYFFGVYLLLRVLVGDRRWALAGTVLAILFQLFAGWPAGLVLWRFPSATIMRWPFDVWVFLACACHLRTRRVAWVVAGGALVGAGVVFQTDTGLALGASFAVFWLFLWRIEGSRILRKFAASSAMAVLVVVVGLGVGSRWTQFSGAFWDGWLENLRLSAAGATFLPLTTEPTTRSVVFFVGIAAGYLVLVGCGAVLLVRRRLSTSIVMLTCIAFYGFFTLLYFVGRSNPLNLFRPTVPFAILLATCGGLGQRSWVERPRRNGDSTAVGGFVACTALCLTAVLFATHPGARVYPGLLRSTVTDSSPRGVCLFEHPDDVCGLAPEAQRTVDDLRSLATRLRALGSLSRPVAILDEIGPVILHMSSALPWGRYQPVFAGLFTRAQVADVGRDLRAHPPGLVVMRALSEESPFYVDIWHLLRPSVERGYVFDSRHGPFEIWVRP